MLRRVREGVLFADRLTRLHLLFFTALWPLLGASSVAPKVAWAQLAMLLGVVVCFHVYAYVLNDVIDLPIDRTQPARARDPLVRGAIRPTQALTIALLQPLLATVITIAFGGSAVSVWLLAAGFGLMAAYDLWGKRCPVPPVTDAVQGLAWGCLALYASRAVGAAPNALTWFIVADAMLFTMFINGIHGSFRDLANDIARGARTTAIWLGARPAGAAGGVRSPLPLTMYAWVVIAGLVALNAWLMIRNDFGYGPVAWTLTSLMVGAVSVAGVALQPQVLRPRGTSGDVAWRLQMYVMVLSLPLAFLGHSNARVTAVFVLLNLLAFVLWNCTGDVVRWVARVVVARPQVSGSRAPLDDLAPTDSASR